MAKSPGLAALACAFDLQPHSSLKTPGPTVASHPDIQALTQALRRGDVEAFSCLYDLYSFRLYKFLLVLARGDQDAAREVCQAVFIKLSSRCEKFETERSFWSWLCVLAKNSFIDHYRRRERQNRFVPLDELAAGSDAEPETEHQLAEMLAEVLAALAPDERELLQAAYVDKRPLRELADEAGQSYKAVESRLGRLRHKLKDQLLKNLRHENEF